MEHNPYNNPDLHRKVEKLFAFVPPQQLRRSVIEVFFRYAINAGGNIHTGKFRQVSEDLYFLNKFLEEIE